MDDYLQPRFLRLKTGEDIICECVQTSNIDTNDVTWDLKNPMKILYIPGNSPGIYHIGLMPWLFDQITDVTTVTLKDEDVLFDIGVNERLTTHYWKYIAAPEESDQSGFSELGGIVNEEVDGEDEEEFSEMILEGQHQGTRTYH